MFNFILRNEGRCVSFEKIGFIPPVCPLIVSFELRNYVRLPTAINQETLTRPQDSESNICFISATPSCSRNSISNKKIERLHKDDIGRLTFKFQKTLPESKSYPLDCDDIVIELFTVHLLSLAYINLRQMSSQHKCKKDKDVLQKHQY
jgi:hypothetical protein